MQETCENLMGQYRDCRPSDPFSVIQNSDSDLVCLAVCPLDFHLFTTLPLRHHFYNDAEMKQAVCQFFASQDTEFYQDDFIKLIP